MDRPLPQKIAAGWTLLMAALLIVVQFTVETPPPLPLFLLFTGVWLFGAAMLWWFPRFGAIGTALYGVLLGVQVLMMHGPEGVNLVIAVGSFIATLLAVWALVVVWRRG